MVMRRCLSILCDSLSPSIHSSYIIHTPITLRPQFGSAPYSSACVVDACHLHAQTWFLPLSLCKCSSLSVEPSPQLVLSGSPLSGIPSEALGGLLAHRGAYPGPFHTGVSPTLHKVLRALRFRPCHPPGAGHGG